MSRGPVLIGWSQLCRFDGEPLDAWAEALRQTGLAPSAIDSLDVVYCQSWPYDDPVGRLADAVGADPARRLYTGIGGTTPLIRLAAAAERIDRGEADVCAIVGGEALASKRTLKKAGERPAWSFRDPEKKPFPMEAMPHPGEIATGLYQAYSTFALRDIARRAHRGETVEDHRGSIGELFAPMTEVAAANPYAWFPIARSADELSTVTSDNRLVAYPYTKLTVAMMDVDLAGALVVASTEAADRLGVPADRRIHLRGWAAANDPDHVAEHDDLWRSPAMAAAANEALARAGIGADDIAHFELYSCFASSITFALDALRLPVDDPRGPFTVTGGLPYAGGPGSCYGIGATAAMADVLVADPGSLGLVTGVGMHLSKHAAMVLSTKPGTVGPPVDPLESVRRPIVDSVDGAAVVAAYTVHHDRDGATDAVLVCDVNSVLPDARCYARSTNPDFLRALETQEWVGRPVTLRHIDGVNETDGS